MRRLVTLFAAAVLALSVLGVATPRSFAVAAAPEPAAAAGDHAGDHGSHDKGTAIPSAKQGLATGVVALVVFALVAAFLGTSVWPKISGALEARENKIRDEIESAQLAREQARDALAQYEKNLAEARAEAKRMLDQAKSEQQALAAELRARADAELNQLRERAMRDIEAAKRAAVNEMYAESATLASHMASKILRREVSSDDQTRLVEESLRELDLVRSN